MIIEKILSDRSAKDVLDSLTFTKELCERGGDTKPPSLNLYPRFLLVLFLFFISIVISAALSTFFHIHAVQSRVILFFSSFAAAYLLGNRIKSSKKEHNPKEFDFFLPLVIERITMGVQAGLDIVPAMRMACEIGNDSQKRDPVLKLLSNVINLIDAGQSVEEALQAVSDESNSIPVRHAFTHMVLAYRDGGGLAGPLQELADATHLSYQETIDEEISRLPARATLPLLMTFVGLIISLLTSPIMQIMKLTHSSGLRP